MSACRRVMMETPALLEFRGPDALRFLNGQLTQDVRRVAGGKISLPSCVTDAKGKMQFRVRITETPDGALWVEGPACSAESLEARLTRYLIADDVEVADLSGNYRLMHLIGPAPAPPEGVISRESIRFGVDGSDWWCPAGSEVELPEGTTDFDGDELEAFRIANGVPLWGRELIEGLLPPEAALEASDISYQKGCYIGQEVISRIKFAGKLNKRLARIEFDAALSASGLRLVDADGHDAGSMTSISPLAVGMVRMALAYVKRGADLLFVVGPDGILHPARVL